MEKKNKGKKTAGLNLAFHNTVLITSFAYSLSHTHTKKKKQANMSLGFHGIHDYFHSTMEVHSLVIIRRKWQCKPPSSDKHMNT